MRMHFIHGWGFDPMIWRGMAPFLEAWPESFTDRGYFSGKDDALPEEDHILVTHSFGTMIALSQMTEHCRALIAINGFARFCEGEDYAGVAPRVLERMIKRFEGDPEKVLSDFRSACGSFEPFEACQTDSLSEDLKALKNWDLRKEAANLTIPLLSLHGDVDAILPQAMREDALQEVSSATHASHEHGGHLLPIEQAEWCAGQICDFLEGAL